MKDDWIGAGILKKSKHPKEWQGIPQKDMVPYRRYVNREKPGFCGTYSAAALIHYLVKHQRNHEIDMMRLLSALEGKIDRRSIYDGTYHFDVVNGLNDLLADDEYQAHVRYRHRKLIIDELSKEAPLPVIIGSLSLFGSKYGNHWLLAYSYGYNEDGQLFYKCYDNHGRINAVIPANQVGIAIRLERKDR